MPKASPGVMERPRLAATARGAGALGRRRLIAGSGQGLNDRLQSAGSIGEQWSWQRRL
jgi:hypothetical protein